MKKQVTFFTLCSLLFSAPLVAQNEAVSQGAGALGSNQMAFLIIIGVIIGVILLLLILMIYLMSFISAVFQKENPQQIIEASWWEKFKERFVTGDVEKEQATGQLMTDHSYDGIQELDNFMPPWLQYVFSGTVVIAVVYFGYYTVLGFGKTGLEEYQEEIRIAAVQAELRGASTLASIDETTVEYDNTDLSISAGKTIFGANCAACHAADGGGGIGPNLTDQYWIHGGDIQDVFRVIKYGVIDKGMVPWEDQLSPVEIQKVSSYIISIQGTSPAVAKDPQGDLYEGVKDAPADASSAPADSIAVASVVAE